MATTYVKKVGNVGIGVNKLQGYLNIMQSKGYINNRLTLDGVFGSDTKTSVQQYQSYAGLIVDGIVGELTWNSIVNKLNELGVYPIVPVASSSYYLELNQTGLDVYEIQSYLNKIYENSSGYVPLNVDGIYGTKTKKVVTLYQSTHALSVDGLCGTKTWDSIVTSYLKLI